MSWGALLLACAGCYVLKVAGTLIPKRLLERNRVRDAAALLPVALIVALVMVNTFDGGRRLTLDARALGVAAAAVAVRLRAPFLVVVVTAGATAALARLAT